MSNRFYQRFDGPEPPLSDRELHIIRCILEDDPGLRKLRGVIDDHEYQLQARRRWTMLFTDVRSLAGVIAALVLVALQIAELFNILHH